jgi:hypothetical protein
MTATLVYLGRGVSAEDRESNRFTIALPRRPRITDASVILDRERNPRWLQPGSMTLDSTQSDDAVARELFEAKSTEALEAILESGFVLVRDGQLIHSMLMGRAFGSSDANGPETLVQPLQRSA